MDKKLSIRQRSTDKPGWDKTTNFTSSDISGIKVFNLRNDKSLNAIPSPLARMHLFEAAFELLDKDESNNTNYSGDAFKKLVSDCFDVFELVYNWNKHLRDGKELKIIKWNKEKEIEILKRENQKHKLLGETLEVFLEDKSFENCNDILIIKLNNRVIAGSSPYTGFFTAPGKLADLKLNNPTSESRGNYFSKIIPFNKRNRRIKKFISDFFKNPSINNTSTIIRNYLDKFKNEIESNLNLSLEDLNSQNNILFNLSLQTSKEKTAADYFEKHLIRINYRLNDECFYTPGNIKSDRTHDYLLPLTDNFFEDFSIQDIVNRIKYTEIDNISIEFTIDFGNILFSKKYYSTKIDDQDGELIDLNQDFNIKINLGIFPFLKVLNESTPYNDLYKVLFVSQDSNYTYKNNDYKVSFRIGKDWITPPTNDNYITSKTDRTVAEKSRATTSSTYYTIKGNENRNVCFDLIRINFPFKNAKAIIAPKWIEKKIESKEMDFAVDFGTTTTFIAFSESKKKPESISFTLKQSVDEITQLKIITENHVPVTFLNKPKEKTEKLSWIRCYEEALNDFLESIEIQRQEFLPSVIDKEKYSLPFRSVIYKKNQIEFQNTRLFENSNIGFLFQKQINFATKYNQEYVTNLKWNIKNDKVYESLISVFIEEILYLIRFKKIMSGGNPANTKITWFSPLSFTPIVERDYREIWERNYKEIFKCDSNENIRNVTESEAPFYYFSKEAIINNEESCLTIDIGGGTTDIMFIQDNNPKLCSSFHFGANILWGNGFNEFENAKENGIYLKLKDEINKRFSSTVLKSLNEEYNSNFGSDEILNFWIYKNDISYVLKDLNKGIFKISFLLHLSSIIYHSLKLLKYKNIKSPPKSVIFSGSGSKYIDLIQTKEYVEKIIGYFSKKIFEGNNSNSQVILEEKNRKEATCYGGLYIPFNYKKSYESINYMGFEMTDEVVKKYKEIDENEEKYFANALNSFNEFIKMFFSMNDTSELSFKNNFGIDNDLVLLSKFFNNNCKDFLKLGYSKRKKQINPDDDITDTLFFYPLIGLIFQLNKLSEAEIKKLVIPVRKKFGVSYDNEKGFEFRKLSDSANHDSIFRIEYEEDNSESAEIDIIENDSVYKKTLDSIDGYLKPVCEWKEYPNSNTTSIEILEPGTLEKRNNSWFINKKIKIRFI